MTGSAAEAPVPSPARTAWAWMSERRPYLLLVLLGMALYLPWITAEPVMGPLEANRLQASREMLRRGDWVMPTLNGEPYLAKPPFQYWLIEIASLARGGDDASIATGRTISALAVIVLMLLVFRFARRELGASAALVAALFVATSGVFLEKGVRAELETLLALTTSAAILFLFEAVWAEGSRTVPLLVSSLALGAAELVKGPVPVIFFLLAACAMCWGSRGRRAAVVRSALLVLLLASLLCVPWLVAVYRRTGATSIATFTYESTSRIRTPGGINEGAWWFYGPALPGALGLASVFIPGLVFLRGLGRSAVARGRALLGLLIGWTLLCLLALNLSAAKETRYLIATVPGWALAIAWGMSRGAREGWYARYLRVLAVLARVVGWLVPPAVLVGGWVRFPETRAWSIGAAVVLLLARALVAIGERRARPVYLAAGLLVGVLGLKVVWAQVICAQKQRMYPIERMGREVAASLAPGEPLVMIGDYQSHVHYAVDRPLLLLRHLRDLDPALAAPGGPHCVLVYADQWPAGAGDRLTLVRTWHLGKTEWRLLRAP